MDDDLRLVRYFLAVAEELHFRRAAARLFVSQPTLSDQIRKLEHHLGVQLFDRTSRGVVLTPAGKEFQSEARRLLAVWQHAVEVTRLVAESQAGHFLIGFVANAAAELTPVIVRRFLACHPDTCVQMHQYDFRDPLAGLTSGDVDVALVRPPLGHHSWLCSQTLFTEPRVLTLSRSHPLAQRNKIIIQDVLDEPFVAHQAPAAWRNFWLALEVREGHPVRIGCEVRTMDECLESILIGAGIAFTQASSQRFYARPELAFVPTDRLPPTCVAVAWRTDHETALVHDFVRIASEVARTDAFRIGSRQLRPGRGAARRWRRETSASSANVKGASEHDILATLTPASP